MNEEELFDNYINGNMSYFATEIKKIQKKKLMNFLFWVHENNEIYFFGVFSKVTLILRGN